MSAIRSSFCSSSESSSIVSGKACKSALNVPHDHFGLVIKIPLCLAFRAALVLLPWFLLTLETLECLQT
jgi:hypothetical protein